MRLINVIFSKSGDKAYTYYSDFEVVIGQIVLAPIRNRTYSGVVSEINVTSSLLNIKQIISKTCYIIPKNMFQWIIKAAEYNMLSPGNLFELCLVDSDYTEEPLQAYYFYSKLNNFSNSIATLVQKLGKRAFEKNIISGQIIPTTFEYKASILLNKKQQDAVTEIENNLLRPTLQSSLQSTSLRPILLRGPTGSGKTNIYFAIVDFFLKQGKQVLILMPEVALTESFASRVIDSFSHAPHLWSHKTSSAVKYSIWNWALSGEPGILIGSRSALWLPFSNLGCIVVDEEHDQSYKQENTPRYHARDMAVLRSKYEKCACILVSATPALETWFNSQNNRYHLVELDGYQPINTMIVKRKAKEWLSDELKNHMTETLNLGQQCMLFLNRRGFAPHIFCTACENYLSCEHCSAHLILHTNSLTHCTYCSNKKIIYSCPKCKSKSWELYGLGIERIEEDVRLLFPDAKVATFSGDTTQISDYIDLIHRNELNIIIATQILSKGHNFPNLTLVGIIQGDHGLRSQDPRNTERIYQLLTQVRGRCGRNNIQSSVIIQSNDVQNKLMQSVIKNDFKEWVSNELENRKEAKLPPFFKLIRIIISSKYSQNSENDAKFLYERIASLADCTIYPPTAATLYKHKSYFRYSMLIRYSSSHYPQPKLRSIIDTIKFPHKSRMSIDVDPYTFF